MRRPSRPAVICYVFRVGSPENCDRRRPKLYTVPPAMFAPDGRKTEYHFRFFATARHDFLFDARRVSSLTINTTNQYQMFLGIEHRTVTIRSRHDNQTTKRPRESAAQACWGTGTLQKKTAAPLATSRPRHARRQYFSNQQSAACNGNEF